MEVTESGLVNGNHAFTSISLLLYFEFTFNIDEKLYCVVKTLITREMNGIQNKLSKAAWRF